MNATAMTLAPPSASDAWSGRERLDMTRKAFRFLHLAHNSKAQDIYCAYIVLALGLSECASAAQKVRPLRPAGVNLLSLAEMTGIPRETVRRKLLILIRLAVVQQDDDRTYRLCDSRFLDSMTQPLEIRPA